MNADTVKSSGRDSISRRMRSLRDRWRQWTTTRYTRLLEVEVDRLRDENRALLNSILGISGVPPIVTEARIKAGGSSDVAGGASGDSRRTKDGQRLSPGSRGGAAPLRRRSWHQINRTLEIDAARKKEAPPGGAVE